MKHFLKISTLVLIFLLFAATSDAQIELQRGTAVPVKCGDIIGGSFSVNYEEQTFTIQLKAGDILDVSATPLGRQLNIGILVTGPTNLGVVSSMGSSEHNLFRGDSIEVQPKINTDTLSASGDYTIRLVNFIFNFYKFDEDRYVFLGDPGGVGDYTLYIGCTSRDGTVINPGDITAPHQQSGSTPTLLPPNFVGFPGLAPIDFSSIAKIPLIAGVPMAGGITPFGGEILGYTLDANAGDKVDFTFNKSGNLNLGLVVLSPDNKVVFQASLVTSESLTMRFTLPTAGTYTIGVFRIDLLPPDLPQPTAFQVQATLNP